MELHSLLKRQIIRNFGSLDAVPSGCEKMIGSVNEAYWQMDIDREMLERSLDLSSQELLQSNSEMRAVFQAFPDLLFRTDRGGTILDYQTSDGIELHVLREKVIGKQIGEIFPRNVGKKFGKAIDQTQKERSIISIEYSVAERNKERWYEARLLPLLESQIVIIVREITIRKQAEEALRESQQRLSDIIDFLPDATFAIDRQGKVIAWNRAIEEMTGVKAEEMIGKGDYEYAIPFYGMRRPILIDLVFISDEEIEKKYRFIEKKGDILFTEADVPLKNQHRILWGKARPLYDSGGNIIGAIESIRDITDRKHMEAALRESGEKYRSLASTADSMYLVDRGYRYLFMNEKHLSRFGLPLDQIIGRPYGDFHSEKSTRDFIEKVDHVFETGKSIQNEYRSERDGRYFLRTYSPVKDREGITTIAVTVASKDITERKRAEEERERLILELKEALSKIRTLSGLLPICAACKKIRNDKGYWEQLETYISERSEADFSHSICPECVNKLYPKFSI
ncbi:MAG TPA: PAS domain-containing protein [Syntrophales bacterium]|nr:PAS domain-containing protein [Syntrophales bacterium]